MTITTRREKIEWRYFSVRITYGGLAMTDKEPKAEKPAESGDGVPIWVRDKFGELASVSANWVSKIVVVTTDEARAIIRAFRDAYGEGKP